jgi:hypothetical protein
MVHHAVEQEAVIDAFARQALHPRHRQRRKVGSHLHDDPAPGGLDHQGVLEIQGAPVGRARAHDEDGGEAGGQGLDHGRASRGRLLPPRGSKTSMSRVVAELE